MLPTSAVARGGGPAGGQAWRLDLAWNGARYCGWQRQANGRSVQQVLEEALCTLFGGEVIAAKATGRTDAGVHAAQQVVGFCAWTPRSAEAVQRGLNALLPDDICCLAAAHAPSNFDPRGWTLRKQYRYRLLLREARCPFRDPFVWQLRAAVDRGRIAAAAPALVGRHDFSSFRATGCGALHPVRQVESVTLTDADDELQLDFVGNGFLRHQVRIMVGTLVEIGRGRLPLDALPSILEARDRKRAGPTAPPQGLCLHSVTLGEGPRVVFDLADAELEDEG